MNTDLVMKEIHQYQQVFFYYVHKNVDIRLRIALCRVFE
jgi:hypothetical protein